MSATDISFGGFDLNDGVNFFTEDLDDSAPWERAISQFSLARTPGIVVTDDQYVTKKIIQTGKIKGTGLANLEDKITAFMLATNNSHNGDDLEYGYGSGYRIFSCNPTMVNVTRPARAASWANFTIEYTALMYGTDATPTSLFTNYATSGDHEFSLAIGGSAPEQYLQLEITLTTVAVANSNTIYITNPDTGEQMSITRAWVQGDVLAIDTKEQSVKVNNVDVDFDGPFLVYEPGTRALQITSDLMHTDTITASGTWTAPSGITQAYVEAWGGGGGGGGRTNFGSPISAAGAGGGGGAYAASLVTVVPAAGYAVVVGTGGAGSSGNASNGIASTFDTTTVVAKPGSGATGGNASSSAGAGGVTSTSVGTVKFAGGAGGQPGAPSGSNSGNGGEAADSGGAGASGGVGSGIGAGPGGDGGAGVAIGNVGNNGSAPGGGGAGGYSTNTLSGATGYRAGGAGARGEVHVSYADGTGYVLTVDIIQDKKYL